MAKKKALKTKQMAPKEINRITVETKIFPPQKPAVEEGVASPDEALKKTKKILSKKTDSKEKIEKEASKKSGKTKDSNIVKAKVETPKKASKKTTKLIFQINFYTKPGENLYITGSHEIFGNNNVNKALLLEYLNENMWVVSVDIDAATIAQSISYNYMLQSADGSVIYDWGSDKKIDAELLKYEEVLIADTWNHAGYFQNAYYTEPFQNVLLKNSFTQVKIKPQKNPSHIFRIKAPLLNAGETVCISGSTNEFNNWDENNVVLLSRNFEDDYFTAELNLSKIDLPLHYKYGVYDVNKKQFLYFEEGTNRRLYHVHAAAQNKISVINDGFIHLSSNNWRGAGVAIPVFSLRSNKSWGVGEFTDIKLLVDWAKKTGLQLIQILPVNDTNATHSWVDSYPYAAISAFALHPMYLNVELLLSDANKKLPESARKKIEALNALANVDYENVNIDKWDVIDKLYPILKKKTFSSKEYKSFFEANEYWLIPYAAFCYFRDTYKTSDFNKWPQHNQFKLEDAQALFNDDATSDLVLKHCFVQFQLHIQLQEAAQYAHENGIIIKGDIPIGIYRYGADAWQSPELYHMEMQAGAPPDDFAIKGQNWGFPTYNWQKMAEDGFSWWTKRFEQMSNYFDAFRIDHILGFFRIWSIPVNAVEGIMGHFEPCIPVHINEFYERNIWFDFNRYTKPFISENILNDLTGGEANYFKENFLENDGYNQHRLKNSFATQRLVEDYFNGQEKNDFNNWVKQTLFDLISNIILFDAEGSNGQQFHFRFAVESTKSFQYLDYNTQQQLKDLYVDYFFRRQDEFWKKEAMNKLPALKRSTNMLVCGEDLGLVPGSVPAVMNQLGLLSLEIQRMPKQTEHEFFHPADAPYLSVVTPSTHDMSTVRGWWEEDQNKTQRFYNIQMGKWGGAPFFCEPWINKAILDMHFYSPAMWSIFMLQDLLGTDRKLRRENPNEERINVPAITPFYWRYRMHLFLEDLMEADDFNTSLHNDLIACGRASKD